MEKECAKGENNFSLLSNLESPIFTSDTSSNLHPPYF